LGERQQQGELGLQQRYSRRRRRDGGRVPIIARRGELVVPPERVVREEKTPREQRPITVVVNVTAADASSFRASQGQIAADMARAIDRASRNRCSIGAAAAAHGPCQCTLANSAHLPGWAKFSSGPSLTQNSLSVY
jgi:hypothetical protein